MMGQFLYFLRFQGGSTFLSLHLCHDIISRGVELLVYIFRGIPALRVCVYRMSICLHVWRDYLQERTYHFTDNSHKHTFLHTTFSINTQAFQFTIVLFEVSVSSFSSATRIMCVYLTDVMESVYVQSSGSKLVGCD